MVTGCSPQSHYIEDIQYLQAMGFDYIDGEVQANGTTTIFMPVAESLPQSETINVSREDLEDLYSHMQAESSRYVDTSRSRVHLFHQDLAANEGIFGVIDTIQRNPMINQNLKIAMTRGPTKDILNEEYPFHLTVHEYLVELIELNQAEQLPIVDFQDFLYQYYAEGADPFLPLLEKAQNRVDVVGIALFKEDKYIEELSLDKTHVFRKLIDETEEGTINIDIDESRGFALHHLSSSPDWTIKQDADGIYVKVNVNIQGPLREARNINVSKPATIQQLEELAARDFEKQMEEIVHFFQENEIDPIGIGERIGQKVRNFDIKRWEKEEYPNLNVDINVNFTIENTGAVV